MKITKHFLKSNNIQLVEKVLFSRETRPYPQPPPPKGEGANGGAGAPELPRGLRPRTPPEVLKTVSICKFRLFRQTEPRSIPRGFR